MNKLKLYLISLVLLFFFVIVITIDFPLCFSGSCKFVGYKVLLKNNWFALIAFVLFCISIFFWFEFRYKLKGSTNIPFRVIEVENISFEHLTFLATYIVPLIGFNFSNDKFKFIFTVLLVVIGIMYIKTNMFYANPSLALMGYSIYRVEAKFRNGECKKVIVLSLNRLSVDSIVTYIKLDDNVYFGRVLNE